MMDMPIKTRKTLVLFLAMIFLSMTFLSGGALADSDDVNTDPLPIGDSYGSENSNYKRYFQFIHITSLDEDGNEALLQGGQTGDELSIWTNPGRRGGLSTPTFSYLVIPDNAATLVFTFDIPDSWVYDFTFAPYIVVQNEDYEQTQYLSETVNAPKHYRLEISVSEIEINQKKYPNRSCMKLLMAVGSNHISFSFRVLTENTPNPSIQQLSDFDPERTDWLGLASVGDDLIMNLRGKTKQGQKMDLYYQYSVDGESKSALYRENVENGEITIPLTREDFNFGDLTPDRLLGDYYTLDFYTVLDGYESRKWGVSILEPNSPSIIEAGTNHYAGSYTQASLWLNVGATLTSKVSEDALVSVYLARDEEGSVPVSAVTGAETTAGGLPTIEDARGNGRQFGMRIPQGLEPGEYYVILKLTEPENGGKVSGRAVPFTVYSDAQSYVKAALDRLINWYATSSNGGFIDAAGNYVGLTTATSTGSDGRSWESWMFPALGSSYPFDDSEEHGYLFQGGSAAVPDVVDGYLSFTATSPFLVNQTTGEDPLSLLIANVGEVSAETLGPKALFRRAMAITALGGDPREQGLITEMIRCGYQDYDIQSGQLNMSSGGSLSLHSDGFGLAYGLLTLEVCNATTAEGYTPEFRQAGIRALLKTAESFIEGNADLTSDTVGMFLISLPYFKDDPVYGMEVSAAVEKIAASTRAGLYANGGMGDFGPSADTSSYQGNANSMAVMINMLASAGENAESMGSWQMEDGTALTAFIGCQKRNGSFGFYGATDEWMATYQALGAVVELYTGKSCFEIAHETYMENYPEYADTDASGILDAVSGVNVEFLSGIDAQGRLTGGDVRFTVSSSKEDTLGSGQSFSYLVWSSPEENSLFSRWVKHQAVGGEYTISAADVGNDMHIHIYILGDVNKDGTVNVTDATNILKGSAKNLTLDDLGNTIGDIDGDNKLTVTDATNILKFAAHNLGVLR